MDGVAGRFESVGTTQEVVGVISESRSGVGCEMKSKVPIGTSTSCEMDCIMAIRW